nr:hypothetical protein [uncultured Cohaesibacter sp.]
MKKYICIIISVVLGFSSSWILFSEIYKPTESDFLKTTTSFYFKKMSELNLSGFFYTDCHLEKPDRQYVEMGAEKVGVCNLKSGAKVTSLEVIMSSTAQVIFFNFEEFAKELQRN